MYEFYIFYAFKKIKILQILRYIQICTNLQQAHLQVILCNYKLWQIYILEMYSKSGMPTHIICMPLRVETMKITVVLSQMEVSFLNMHTQVPFSFENLFKKL